MKQVILVMYRHKVEGRVIIGPLKTIERGKYVQVLKNLINCLLWRMSGIA